MPASIQLARLFGIRIGASPSWFVVLFAMVYLLAGYFSDALGGSDQRAFVVALLAAVLFFGSIVLHELGHALVARRNGISIAGIDLWFFGGVAKLSRDTRTPGEEFRIAAAGPAVTALIVAVAAGVAIALSDVDAAVDAASFSVVQTSPGVALAGWLAAVNLFLLLFNLVPAFPLDGGRIARAIAWRVTGDQHRSTRMAGRVGQGFAYLLMAGGAYLALTTDPVNGIWFVVLGFFLNQGARGAVLQSVFAEAVDGVTAGELADASPMTIPAETPVGEARDEFFRRLGHPWFVVTDDAGRFVGVLDEGSVEDAVAQGSPATAGEAVVADSVARFAVPEAAGLTELLGYEALRRLGALAVLGEGGRLAGVVTVERVQRAVAAAAPGPS